MPNIQSKEIPPIYAILSLDLNENPLSYAEQLLYHGIEWIQVRDKSGDAKKNLLVFGEKIIEKRNLINPKAKIIVNDYIDICKEIHADGVHLGQTDDPPVNARTLLGEHAVIGLSTHSILQVKQAPQEILTYVACGPVFLSSSKSGHAPVIGTSLIREIKKLLTVPLVAIGGITQDNADSVFKAGADSIALISELQNTSNLQDTITTLMASSNYQ
jgi:thiamine-phosphate pyrophosphorylase